jgi:hypothetical protein
MRLTITIAITLCALTCSALADDMNFTLQEKDWRPNFDLYQWIFADGEIVQGTTAKFLAFVNANPQLIRGATVILNSPGGSPSEGMQLGDSIRALHYRTDVGSAGLEPMQRRPGKCMSACIFPYLGGEYRYLAAESAIGIHQFRFDRDVGGSVATQVSQLLSGEIVAFIKRSRADPNLFALMTQTPPDDIHIISPDDLNKLRVVTNDLYKEEWTFEVRNGRSYLKADQITWRGENKFLFICDGHKTFMMTLTQLPDRDTVIREAKNIIVMINEQSFPVASGDVAQRPSPSGDSYVKWTITLSRELAGALKVADTIGSVLSPAPGIFGGVKGIRVGDGREKLVRTLAECQALQGSSSAASIPPSSASSPANVNQDDTALAKRVARNFDQQFKKAGMAGLKVSIDACYVQARKTPKESTIEYCYLLDQLACSVDETATKKMNISQENYWYCTTALARTMAAMTLIQADPQARSWTLQRWVAAKAIAFGELVSFR